MTRTVLSVTGTDRRSFLQGLVSNDMGKLDQGLVYAAILTPQGKFLADFLMLERGDEILIDIATSHAAPLAQRLNMYKLRADVQISATDLRVSRGLGDAPNGAFADPRDPELGWRLFSDTALPDETDWDAIRVARCIPETGIELTPDTYILEVGFERLNGVDFRKGCYVGQEVTARMKHKTELKKGLVTVSIDGAVPVGTAITQNGKPAGTLFTQSNGRGIAYLRYDRAKGPMQAEGAEIRWTPDI